MNEVVEQPAIDKSTWGEGPWQAEPDRAEWEHAGLPCLAVRHPSGGHWCGYAAVPPGHPLHRTDYDRADVEAHGGLTYANACNGDICHVPKPGEPDNVWWFGFDCAHAGDFNPGYGNRLRRSGPPYNHAQAVAANNWQIDTYRTLDYVREITNRLAEQLQALGQQNLTAALR